jgi:hypothetical protein
MIINLIICTSKLDIQHIILQSNLQGKVGEGEKTFPNSWVEIMDTFLLFSVNTLQYLLFTAIGFT